MAESKPCNVCGKLTNRLLFGCASVRIHICSTLCEWRYFESLRHNKEEKQNLLRYLDEKIGKIQRYSRVGWVSAAIGIVWIALVVLLIRLPVAKNLEVCMSLFFIGVSVATCGALSTSYFDDRKRRLMETRKKLA